MRESSAQMAHDVTAFRKAITEEGSHSGHVIMNWVQVGLLIGSMLVSVGGSSAVVWWRLGTIDNMLHEMKGSQDRITLEVARLQSSLEDEVQRSKEDRNELSKLRYQMSYRLQFEASAKALHPGHPWP